MVGVLKVSVLSLPSSDTVATTGLEPSAPGGAFSSFRQPLRFSAAQEPQDDRYALARDEAECTDACAWVWSALVAAVSQRPITYTTR